MGMVLKALYRDVGGVGGWSGAGEVKDDTGVGLVCAAYASGLLGESGIGRAGFFVMVFDERR